MVTQLIARFLSSSKMHPLTLELLQFDSLISSLMTAICKSLMFTPTPKQRLNACKVGRTIKVTNNLHSDTVNVCARFNLNTHNFKTTDSKLYIVFQNNHKDHKKPLKKDVLFLFLTRLFSRGKR